VVTAKLVEAGSAVTPNQRLFDLADVSLLVVRVQVSELDVVHLAAGARVVVRLDAFPAARIEGSVRRVFPSADPQSRLVPVEVALGPRPRGLDLKPGFLARIEFALERGADALATPAAAVGVGATGPSSTSWRTTPRDPERRAGADDRGVGRGANGPRRG
jgi:multidrug efflux pump subunit AcrA (membrane-fusion protein)